MLQQKADTLKGEIILNDCDLSKTIITFTAIVFASHQNTKSPYQPTLVVILPSVVDTWIIKYIQHFTDAIMLKLYHEIKTGTISINHKQFLINSARLKFYLQHLNSDNSDITCTVLLTTYSSWSQHCLNLKNVPREEIDINNDNESTLSKQSLKKKRLVQKI